MKGFAHLALWAAFFLEAGGMQSPAVQDPLLGHLLDLLQVGRLEVQSPEVA
eukprot:CAMPEP_0181473854 /NCGR_PEP_ID=MMETSP1110-20121109/40341_1 /TAXON_ID=174948 /ORGANISM="Symbiodinium sp., Strain CCMP421" /LENGTH=50 /DNA_ID=CAMNT_0023598989 /DNA_START=190 /DNA_END=338 /DNA_ORIENTATION=+